MYNKPLIVIINEKPEKLNERFQCEGGRGGARTHEACSAARRGSRPPEPLRKLRQAHLLCTSLPARDYANLTRTARVLTCDLYAYLWHEYQWEFSDSAHDNALEDASAIWSNPRSVAQRFIFLITLSHVLIPHAISAVRISCCFKLHPYN